MTAVPPRARRRAWPWIVSILVVLVLVVVAALLGELIARDVITKTIRQQAITQLALPADQDVQVEIPGAVIPQLIGGSLATVRLSSADVALGQATGDVSVTLTDVSVRDLGSMGDGTATVALDQTQLRGLMSSVDGFPADTVGLAAPDVTMTTNLSLLGASFPVGVALTPSAADGGIVLHPDSLTLGGAKISADDLRARFGVVADAALRDWNVCVAQYLPKGIALDAVAVTGDRLVADFALDGAIATDPALRAKGTCA